jgi:hypothetical protein
MKKLALKLDELNVQSFDTMPSDGGRRGTVLGLQEFATDEQACTDVCSLVPTCYSCETCDAACDPGDTVDVPRRIILY